MARPHVTDWFDVYVPFDLRTLELHECLAAFGDMRDVERGAIIANGTIRP